ncbi:uncharacterized protein [Nicotiana sylvestris]|uniref:uncharacterized protein n=1 Tax=Nicotiana sylvestris TaxID=4096 RepID=UPI00388C3FBD
MERYKVARKEDKLPITEAKTAAYDPIYGEKKLFWLAKLRERKARDLDQDIVLGKLEHSESHRDFGYYRRIKVEVVMGDMHKISRGRATGPDKIPVKFWKYVGRTGLEWLTMLFNVISKAKGMSDVWRWSTVVPLYKNKADIQL